MGRWLTAALAAWALASSPAWAQMMGGGMSGRGYGMGYGMGMGAMTGQGGMGTCGLTLGGLDLSEETLAALEQQRFEVQKKIIRDQADLRVLRLELGQLLREKNFDLKVARQAADKVGAKEAEVRAAQLDFLHAVGTAVTQTQWDRLVRYGCQGFGGEWGGIRGGRYGPAAPPEESGMAGRTAGDQMVQGQMMGGSMMGGPMMGGQSGQAAPAGASGEKVYEANCRQCHASGAGGAQRLGDTATWAPLLAEGTGTLVQRAIEGYRGSRGYMPPKGGNPSLTDQEVKAAVQYMVQESR